MTLYYAETRSLLQNGQPKPSLSTFDQPEMNADGSIDIYDIDDNLIKQMREKVTTI